MENTEIKRNVFERFAPLAINAGICIGLQTAGNKLADIGFNRALREKKHFTGALLAVAGQTLQSTAWLAGLLLPVTIANACIPTRDFNLKVEDIKDVDVIEDVSSL